MRTRITELFGIRYPIVLPGMSWISVPELVAAVCNAGGIGYLATGPLNTEQTRESIRRLRTLTERPFGAGVTLLMPGARENAEVIIQEQVPVVNVSLGKCDWIAERVHAYGGKVIATVTTEKHARAAERQGADALQVTGNEAAAHGSQVGSLVLTPAIVRAVELPVVAIGGFADGFGLAAALALGAEGIGMGTRLSMTKESPVHEATKEAQIKGSIEDTLYSDRFDGLWCRVLDTKSARTAIRRGMNLPKAAITSFGIARDLKLSWPRLLVGTMRQGTDTMIRLAHMATAFEKIKVATEDGDLVKGVHLTGQVQGLIHDLPTVAEVIDRTMEEAGQAYARMGALLG
jgi:NAD(P)H-dependent flavin oxidoreductase YrpB (nitropropane dioxygenase family)